MKKFRGTSLTSLILCLFVLIVSQISCTPKKIASDITSQIFAGGAPVFEAENDVQIAEQSGIPMIKMLESFQYDNPKNKTYLILLSRSYAGYAFGFLEWNMLKYKDVDEAQRSINEQRAKDFYSKGKAFGMQVLTRNTTFEKALKGDIPTFKKALKGFGRSSVSSLYWTAFNWGSWINLNKDSPLAISEFPKAEAMMQRVLELDENYFYAGPHLFIGYSYGARSSMFGGNPALSKEHFEKAMAATKRKFLMALVAYAQSYCVQNQDRTLFDSLLNEVLATPADSLPEQRLANELAHLRARWLLDHESTMF